MQEVSKRPSKRWMAEFGRRRALIVIGALLLAMGFGISGVAVAAEVAGGETYRLPQGEVIDDDLYVSAGEIFIDGTVEGDLIATGGYIEVDGVVTGDVILAGGGIVISGVIQDDARIVGASVEVRGSIGDDLFMAGGGTFPGMPGFPFQIGNRSITPGVRFESSATVGGDAYIVGGHGVIAGSIAGDLFSGMGTILFGGRVGGDADLNAEVLQIDPASQVDGELTYTSGRDTIVPEDVAPTVVQGTPESSEPVTGVSPFRRLVRWIVRTIMVIAGLSILGWLVLQFRPQILAGPAASIQAKSVETGIFGVLVAVAVVPVSAALIFLAVIFWGWFPGGVVTLAFLFGAFSLIWIGSPIITGLWLGRKLTAWTGLGDKDLISLLVGIVAIVLVGRVLLAVPCVGQLAYWTLYLMSFALAVGGWVVARRQSRGDVEAVG